jgi:hypothetical protein
MNRMAGKLWVNVGVFVELNEAQVVETILTSRGFKARTHFDKVLQLFLFLRPPRKTFRVQVRDHEFRNAMNLLEAEPGLAAKLHKALHCPDCGSLRVEYPQMTRKFILPTVLLHLGIIFHVIEHECYCESCHCIWNLPPKFTPPMRRPASP